MADSSERPSLGILGGTLELFFYFKLRVGEMATSLTLLLSIDLSTK
jgi:hypothetical protein